MKKIGLFSLLACALCLVSCSYRGDKKVFLDANTVMNNEVTYDESSFEIIDANIKANNCFCVYISKEDCDACAQFKNVYLNVLKESKILAFRMEVYNEASKNVGIAKLFEAYPTFYTGEAPSFFICQGTAIEQIPFSRLTSNTKFKNALKEKVSLSDIYYSRGSIDYQAFANQLKKEVTVISVNLYNITQLTGYRDFIKNVSSTTLVMNDINALTLVSFTVQPK